MRVFKCQICGRNKYVFTKTTQSGGIVRARNDLGLGLELGFEADSLVAKVCLNRLRARSILVNLTGDSLLLCQSRHFTIFFCVA